jgi:hypothetical protein
MLLKTTLELKAFFPRLLAKLNSNALLPDMDRAAQKYLVQYTGKALYDQYVTLYNAGNAAGVPATILKNMQRVVAAYALLDDLGTTTATITDSGLQSAETSNMPRVYGWAFKEFRKSLSDAAADAVDVLLQSLWDNKGSLAAWTSSEAYKSFSTLLIRTAADFNAAHTLYQPQRTFYAVKSLIRDVQESIIGRAIGVELVSHLVGADLSDAEKKCLHYLQKSIAFYTIKKACEHYSVRLSDAGFTIVSGGDGENSDTAGRTDAGSLLMLKMQACERDGKTYLTAAKRELAALYANPAAIAAFKTAYEGGPLKDWNPDRGRDLGNNRRKIFRT